MMENNQKFKTLTQTVLIQLDGREDHEKATLQVKTQDHHEDCQRCDVCEPD